MNVRGRKKTKGETIDNRKEGRRGNIRKEGEREYNFLFCPFNISSLLSTFTEVEEVEEEEGEDGPLHSIRGGDGGDPKRVATVQFRNSQWPKFSIEARLTFSYSILRGYIVAKNKTKTLMNGNPCYFPSSLPSPFRLSLSRLRAHLLTKYEEGRRRPHGGMRRRRREGVTLLAL